jgi:hypothetical protein
MPGMLHTVSGVYENGKVRLNEHLALRHARVLVTFLDDERTKTLDTLPSCFNDPVKVEQIRPFSRDELHER